MYAPISYFAIPTSLSIEVLLDSSADLTIAKAPLLYNKKHAFTIEHDDTLKDLYESTYKLINGGIPVLDPTWTSPGYFITDGCGNNIPFKASSTAFVKRYSPEVTTTADLARYGGVYLDWLIYSATYGANQLSYAQLTELMNAGYGINDHGFFGDLEKIPTSELGAAVSSFINWSESHFHVRPLAFVAPGGVTFDYASWRAAWFAQGARFSTLLSGSGSDTTRIDNMNMMTMTDTAEVGRYSIESKTAATLNAKLDTLMALANNQWLRTFGHTVKASTFINYTEYKAFIQYMAATYGSGGLDNLWVASTTDLISYMYCRDSIILNDVVDGNKHTITLNTASVPAYITRRALTLLFSSTANIVSIKVNGYTHSKNSVMVNLKIN